MVGGGGGGGGARTEGYRSDGREAHTSSHAAGVQGQEARVRGRGHNAVCLFDLGSGRPENENEGIRTV